MHFGHWLTPVHEQMLDHGSTDLTRAVRDGQTAAVRFEPAKAAALFA